VASKNHIATSSASGGASAGEDFPASVELRERSVYFPAANNSAGMDFFGQVVLSSPLAQTVTAAHLSRPDGAQLEVGLQGVTTGAHQVTVALNGTSLGTLSLTDLGTGVATFPAASIMDGDNTVTLTASTSGDVSLVDHITLTYQRTYRADGDTLEFTVAGSEQVVVGGFTNSHVRMIDITDPSAPEELAVTVTPPPAAAGSFTATAPGTGPRTILAFGADRVATPDSITLHIPLRLTPLAGRVDTIVITTAELMNAVQPLINLRESQGLRVKPVDIAQVYDAFSFGEKDPQAIRDFLAATQRAKHAPHYVLLVGDASYDPRNFLGLGSNPDLVPTKLINTEFFQAASDGWFADFANDNQTQMAIGRLPAETPADVASLVAKIIRYDSLPQGNAFLLASDHSDDEPGFTDASISLVSLLPPGTVPTMITRVPDNSNRQELLNDINSSPNLINYIGHGSEDIWAGNWLSAADAAALTNSGHPAFFVLMTCLNGFFADPQLNSIAESLLRAEGGAVAVWASSGVTVPSGQLQANQALYQLLFATAPAPPLGEAVRQAKNLSADPDVRQTWNLLGDPETHLR
jgi:hypothetical protein